MSNPLKDANELFRKGDFKGALSKYEILMESDIALPAGIERNIKAVKTRLKDQELLTQKVRAKHQLQIIAQEERFKNINKRGNDDYGLWLTSHQGSNKSYSSTFEIKTTKPKFSVLLPVYVVKSQYLKSAIFSVINQTYGNWQLCIVMADTESGESKDNIQFLRNIVAFDNRVKLQLLERNLGISGNTNACLEMATGEFICLLDHDDELSLDALMQVSNAIDLNRHSDFFYTDKDSILADGQTRVNPLLKPKWSPEIMLSANYLTHFNVMRRELVTIVGGWDSKTDGAQDWDIFLRVIYMSRNVYHVEKICYHWRIHPQSTSTGLESKPYASLGQLTTIQKYIAALGYDAKAIPDQHGGYRILWSTEEKKRHVHILLHGENYEQLQISENLLKKAINNIALNLNVSFSKCSSNKIIDTAINLASNNYDSIVFISEKVTCYQLSDLMEIIDWTTENKDVAFCSGLVLSESGKVASGGVLISDCGNWVPLFSGCDIYEYGPFGGVLWYRNWRAVLPNFAAIKCQALSKISHFVSEDYEADFVNLCFAMWQLGFRGLTTPHAKPESTCLSYDYEQANTYSYKFEPYFHDSLQPYPKPKLRVSLKIKENSHEKEIIDKYAHDAMVLAQWNDCGHRDLSLSVARNESITSHNNSPKVCHWYLPNFDSPNYGGVMTILRLASYLFENHGIQHRFIICDRCKNDHVHSMISKTFPLLSSSAVNSLFDFNDISVIPKSDYSIATLWTTAYSVLKVNNTRIKAYMVQDYEPLFYPAGSTMAQAELTYDFGFYGICNSESLHNLYQSKHPGKSVLLAPAVDTNIFFPKQEIIDSVQPKRLFYYARPGAPRNCFELAIEALKKVKSAMGAEVEILCAGANWQPEKYGLEDIVTHMGMLPYHETADLYRSVHVGLALMKTKHPSYLPFELMACGVLVVALKNEANDWLLKNGVNSLLSEASPSCLAETLIEALVNYENYSALREHGSDEILCKYGSWDTSMRRVSEFLSMVY